jgi:hypothetical protein
MSVNEGMSKDNSEILGVRVRVTIVLCTLCILLFYFIFAAVTSVCGHPSRNFLGTKLLIFCALLAISC